MVDLVKSFKILMQTAAFVFFLLQMVLAVEKYLAKPLMIESGMNQFV